MSASWGNPTFTVPDTPDYCETCRDKFMDEPLMQRELIQIGIRGGKSAARAELRDRMEEYHMEHRSSQ